MSIQRVKQRAQEAEDQIRALAATAKGEGEDANAEHVAEEQQDSQPTAEIVDLNQGLPAATVDSDEVTDTTGQSGLQAQLDKLRADLDAAEHKRRTMDGIVRSKDERIDELRDIIANISAQQKQVEQKPAEPEAPVGYSQGDVDTFGADMVDLIQRVARDVSRETLKELKATVEGMQGSLQNVSKQAALSAEEVFQNKLNTVSPGWEKIDGDEKFIEWLKQSPTRNNIFADSVRSLDAVGVSDVMNQYRALHTAAADSEKQANDARQRELEAQVTPSKSRKSASPQKSQAEDKIWARSEIQQVYAEKKKYTPEEFAALEREIAAAGRNQRIDYTS